MKTLVIALVALATTAAAQGNAEADGKTAACPRQPAPAKATVPQLAAAPSVTPRPTSAPKTAIAKAPAPRPAPAANPAPAPAPEPAADPEPAPAAVPAPAPASVAAAPAPVAPAAVPQERRATAGFGIGIVPFDARYIGLPYEVYLPINVSADFRLEPSAGAFTSIPRSGGVERSFVTLGLGAFWVNRVAPATDVYFGGRVKMCIVTTDDGVTNDSENDFSLAAAIGGEYFLGSHFSIGAEGQLGHYQNGRLFGYLSANDRGTFTTGVAFLRFYLR